MSLNSKLQVDSIESQDPVNGPVSVSYGASVPVGQTFNTLGDVNIVGIVTASNFSGNGSGLTNLVIATKSKALAYTFIG